MNGSFDSDIDGRIDRIAQAIARYASLHPNASDTIEGVQRWWLPGSGEATVAMLERALDALVTRHVLNRRALPDGRSIYSVKAETPDTSD